MVVNWVVEWLNTGFEVHLSISELVVFLFFYRQNGSWLCGPLLGIQGRLRLDDK